MRYYFLGLQKMRILELNYIISFHLFRRNSVVICYYFYVVANRTDRRSIMLSTLISMPILRKLFHCFLLTHLFVIWMMKQSAVSVTEYQQGSWYALTVADRARSMQVCGIDMWRQEEEANKTCMHISDYITWRALVNQVWLASWPDILLVKDVVPMNPWIMKDACGVAG